MTALLKYTGDDSRWVYVAAVRTMLEAIISFLPTEGQGAIGALDWTPRERRKLAEEVGALLIDLSPMSSALYVFNSLWTFDVPFVEKYATCSPSTMRRRMPQLTRR